MSDIIRSMSATLQIDRAILEAALAGYELQREQIEGMMTEIRRQLRGKTSSAGAEPAATAGAPVKRTVSAAARKRMAAAQRKRWAASKKTEQPAPQKRTMSAAARKRIGQATKKRWAAFRANKAAAAKAA